MKKNLHPRTDESNENITKLSRKKKAMKNNSETDADSSTGNDSCFEALVKASNIQKDTLELPNDVISSKGLTRICQNHLRCRDSTSPSLNQFMTLRFTHADFRKYRQYLSSPFMRENGLDKSGMITLLGKDGTKWQANRCKEASGHMYLGKGWTDFAKENGLKFGESFTFELICKGATPTLSLFNTESTSDARQKGKCSKDSEKESISTKPSSEKKTRTAKNNREEKNSRELVQNKCHLDRNDSLSPMQNRFVTLTLVPGEVRACYLQLPGQFMRANGIDKLGKITMLGKDGMNYSGYRLSRDGFVAVGYDWKDFCETNGVLTGESFTLEFTNEQDSTPVFKFSSNGGE